MTFLPDDHLPGVLADERMLSQVVANLMTNAALDPFGKIPEFKYCAVAIHRNGVAAVASGYVKD